MRPSVLSATVLMNFTVIIASRALNTFLSLRSWKSFSFPIAMYEEVGTCDVVKGIAITSKTIEHKSILHRTRKLADWPKFSTLTPPGQHK